jgi:hypothetical protein
MSKAKDRCGGDGRLVRVGFGSCTALIAGLRAESMAGARESRPSEETVARAESGPQVVRPCRKKSLDRSTVPHHANWPHAANRPETQK